MAEDENEESFEYASPMHAAAISMHEMYVTLKSSGFKRMEALQLIAMMMSHGISEAIYIQEDEDEEDDDL
jgi:hypothetical protein